MSDAIRRIVWNALSFFGTLPIASFSVLGSGERGLPELLRPENSQPDASQLLGRTVDISALIESQSRAPIVNQGTTVPDTTIVVLLGAIGCSLNQMKSLQDRSQKSGASHPVLAVYADYLMSEASAVYEALVLRRISQADFPFQVSSDTSLSPRRLSVPHLKR